MRPPNRNVELKATDPSPHASVRVCTSLGAVDHGEIWQRDTYFAVPRGGLKLREERPGEPHLIQFEREDRPGERESRYRIIDVEDWTTLREALEAAIGVAAVVVKRRRLFIWRDVRIHLDDVTDLGTFLELEAVAPPGSDLAREYELVAELRVAFGITADRLVSRGYAEQLVKAGGA